MSDKETPAFPVSEENYKTWASTGMTLRDYFAAKAMQGLLAQSCGTAISSDVELGAQFAYEVADAMLEARK